MPEGTTKYGLQGLAALALIVSASLHAASDKEELAKIMKEIEEVRKQITSQPKPIGAGTVDKAVAAKYGPNSPVTTKAGKLKIGGLVQIWYYSIQNDQSALFDDPNINDVQDTNDALDNDSFQVKRTDIIFDMDITENISARLWIDPARENLSFPVATSNQGTFKRGLNQNIANTQSGAGGVPRLVQDAWINYHGVVPHHDFQIGQFRPAVGDEGLRLNGQLDFVERSLIGQLPTNRDTGVQVHGTWWDDRLQYWIGAYNGAGNYYASGGQTQNRSDDNDEKDFNAKIQIRPLWKKEKWGSLELSYSFMGGVHGEESNEDPVADPVNGLNRNETDAMRHYIHAYYTPGGPVTGWWLRGEWAYIRDRNAPSQVLNLGGGTQTAGGAFDSTGWYASTGYHIGNSIFKDSAPSWLKNLEFAARYEEFENVQVTDLVNEEHTDNFETKIWTAGVNYYIKGHNAKIQLNYVIVDDPDVDTAGRSFHDVDNDTFVVNFQVWF
jgi:Phosphate-selective porin O and P